MFTQLIISEYICLNKSFHTLIQPKIKYNPISLKKKKKQQKKPGIASEINKQISVDIKLFTSKYSFLVCALY